MLLQTCLSEFYILPTFLILDMLCSSHTRSEGNDTNLDIMVPVVNGSQTKSDPSTKIQETKVKRKRRQRRLYNETKGMSHYYW